MKDEMVAKISHIVAGFRPFAGESFNDLARRILQSCNYAGLVAEVEALRNLRNLVCCAEEDVTPKMMRKLFDLPDYSSAALQPSDTAQEEQVK